jgi:hypothetical protein
LVYSSDPDTADQGTRALEIAAVFPDFLEESRALSGAAILRILSNDAQDESIRETIVAFRLHVSFSQYGGHSR